MKYKITKELPDKVSCQVLTSNMLSNPKPTIEVVEAIVRESGLFSSKTVYYLIETRSEESFLWRVERSYGEVLWLREQLQKQFPGYIVFTYIIELATSLG